MELEVKAEVDEREKGVSDHLDLLFLLLVCQRQVVDWLKADCQVFCSFDLPEEKEAE